MSSKDVTKGSHHSWSLYGPSNGYSESVTKPKRQICVPSNLLLVKSQLKWSTWVCTSHPLSRARSRGCWMTAGDFLSALHYMLLVGQTIDPWEASILSCDLLSANQSLVCHLPPGVEYQIIHEDNNMHHLSPSRFIVHLIQSAKMIYQH